MLARHMLALLSLAALPPAGALAEERPRIEVAFVLDATGSMGPWIEQARARITAIAEDLARGEPPPEIRFALVSYRDRGDAYVTRVDDFTPDLAEMRAALDRTRAEGGGDHPEAVLEALHAGIHGLSWTKDPEAPVLRLLYLVGDAPPKHYEGGPKEPALLRDALRKGIVIHAIICGAMGSDGQAFFERVARRSEGRAFRLADPGAARAAVAGGGPVRAGGTLAAAVGGSARAYSGAVGVDFTRTRGVPVAAAALPAPPLGRTGLLGAHLRVVSDAATWSDLWAAHTSVGGGEGVRPGAPPVDFARHHVLVLGGSDAGLSLAGLEAVDDVRIARLEPAAPGVRFVLVPAGAPVVAAAAP